MILVDSNNIAYIAYFTLGELSEGEVRTGTIFGFLNKVNQLAKRYSTSMVFCFDSKKNLRKTILPSYKENRHKELTEQEKIELKMMHQQVLRLRKEILPSMGFMNNKFKPGYEADDVIAHYSLKYRDKHKIIIVSTDTDLFQLLHNNVKIFNPRTNKEFTQEDFEKKYGVTPDKWSLVKSIAGDSSDNIKGVDGVGIKTAVKMVNGQLKTTTKAYENIKINWEDVVIRNKRLIHLPLDNGKQLKKMKYRKNKITALKLVKTFDDLKFTHYLKDQEFNKWKENLGLNG